MTIPPVSDFEPVWNRIEQHAGERFVTATGLPFTYAVTGEYVRVRRDGRAVTRTVSRANFARAVTQMPASRPSALQERQASAYTWAVLMDDRIRSGW